MSLTRAGRRGSGLAERKSGFQPAIGAVGVPGDGDITPRNRSLRRVPRHPAVAQAVDHHGLGALPPVIRSRPALR
jgi:hypothetical protein